MPDWFLFSKKRGIISLAVTEKFAIFKFCYEKSEILENKNTWQTFITLNILFSCLQKKISLP